MVLSDYSETSDILHYEPELLQSQQNALDYDISYDPTYYNGLSPAGPFDYLDGCSELTQLVYPPNPSDCARTSVAPAYYPGLGCDYTPYFGDLDTMTASQNYYQSSVGFEPFMAFEYGTECNTESVNHNSTAPWMQKRPKSRQLMKHGPVPSPATSVSSWGTTADDGSRFTCAECGESFVTSYFLESHAKALGHKSYECPETACRRRYRRRDVFVRHKAMHKDETFSCQACVKAGHTKTFSRKDHLRHHQRNSHPNDRSLHRSTLISQQRLPDPQSVDTSTRTRHSPPNDRSNMGQTKSTSMSSNDEHDTVRMGGPKVMSRSQSLPSSHSGCEERRSEGVSQLVTGLRSIFCEKPKQSLSDLEQKLKSMHPEAKGELANEILEAMSKKTLCAVEQTHDDAELSDTEDSVMIACRR